MTKGNRFTKKNKQKRNNKNNHLKTGGKMLVSGGFGCIFEPALQCKGNTNQTNRAEQSVSKLMTIDTATKEFENIQFFKNKLKNIPNYSNYFFLDGFTMCEPGKLTNADLVNFQECKALMPEYNIDSVNNHLNDLRIITMPYGGIDVQKFYKIHLDNFSFLII